MSRIFFTTLSLSLLLLLQLAPSLAANDERNNMLPFDFHSLFPFLGRQEDMNNGDVGKPKEQAPVDPQNQAQLAVTNPSSLQENFYQRSCPNAEKIVTDAFAEIYKQNPGAIGNFLRLQFHDCFVNGCDASILLDYTSSEQQVEKSSQFNGLLLKGAGYVDDIKAKLEQACPQTVSCADVLAFATHEAMITAGMPRTKPRGGRRDSRESLAKNVEANNLPMPDWNLDQMIELFTRKGFSIEEMVILLGAHSVGIAHCDFFMERLYDFKKTGKPDPSLPPDVLEELRQACPNPGTPDYRNPPVNFDATPTVLDNLFFKDMAERKKTLLISDSHLIADQRTAPIAKKMAADPKLFPSKFPAAMLKLAALNVLTGKQGEIRKVCRSTN